jgi:hypothetical protein
MIPLIQAGMVAYTIRKPRRLVHWFSRWRDPDRLSSGSNGWGAGELFDMHASMMLSGPERARDPMDGWIFLLPSRVPLAFGTVFGNLLRDLGRTLLALVLYYYVS